RDERAGCEALVCVQDVPSRSVGGVVSATGRGESSCLAAARRSGSPDRCCSPRGGPCSSRAVVPAGPPLRAPVPSAARRVRLEPAAEGGAVDVRWVGWGDPPAVGG